MKYNIDLKSIEGKKVVVTGGAGFIGSNLVSMLAELGAEVIVIDDMSGGSAGNLSEVKSKVKIVKGSITDCSLLKKEFEGADFVSHHAAKVSVPESITNPKVYNEININGHLNVLQAANECGVKRVVFSSSCAVYGNPEKMPQKENDIPMPLSPYAVTKAAGEHYCRVFSEIYGLEAVSLRYFNVFGPNQSPNSSYAAVIPKFISALINGEKPKIYGDGRQTRDFTFVKNNCIANILAFTTKNRIGGEVINICSGKSITINEILEKINKILNKNIKAGYEPERKGDILHSRGSPEKAEKLLGYKTRIGFEEGLKETVEWFKKNAR